MLRRLDVECLSVEKVATRLYNENDALRERITQLEAERDALMDHVYGSCVTCKHVDKVDTDYPCSECLCKGKTLWEWRGVQKEE